MASIFQDIVVVLDRKKVYQEFTMLIKEFRIPMPISVSEYKVGQLYMIAKHSNEQSAEGEGVEVVANHPHEDIEYGAGQYTEKRIYLFSRLPQWIRSLIPKIFYITEKAWNYYPRTITEYTCSFLPRFIINVKTCYEDNAGTHENALSLDESQLSAREVDFIDIAYDDINPKHYKAEEDLRTWHSEITGRGPLTPDWMKSDLKPMMCSYKLVSVCFEVWGLQTRVEDYVQRAIREILLVGHRQAVAWLDQWFNMTEEDVRKYENEMHIVTNEKVLHHQSNVVISPTSPDAVSDLPEEATPTRRSWFSWS